MDSEKDLKDILDQLNNGGSIDDDIETKSSLEDDDLDEQDIEENEEEEELDPHIVLERLMSENAELKDQQLRDAAEMQNLRKRTQREVKDAKSFSVSSFARDMLGVSDNLRRTIAAAPAQDDNTSDTGLKALLEGVEMTERSMLSALERHGVKKLDALDQKFDPNFHQAMFEVPDESKPNNTVVQVVQDGFIIGDRVLRPAMVGVSKGGPKVAATDNTDNAETKNENSQ